MRRHKKIIEDSNKLIEKYRKDIEQLERLKQVSLIRQDLDYEFSSLSEGAREDVKKVYEGFKGGS